MYDTDALSRQLSGINSEIWIFEDVLYGNTDTKTSAPSLRRKISNRKKHADELRIEIDNRGYKMHTILEYMENLKNRKRMIYSDQLIRNLLDHATVYEKEICFLFVGGIEVTLPR